MSVVITGSPGVGKHTISKKIAKRLGYAIIDTNRVAADAGLAGPDGVVDTDMLGSMMGPTDEAVIVGHLAPYALDAGQTGTVIILRRNPYELVRVYQSRGYPEEKIRDNAGSEILGVIAAYSLEKFGEKAFEIDTTGSGIDESTSAVMSAISGDAPHVRIDWLEEVTQKGDLQRFFGY